MTSNQIAYQKLQEEERKNKMAERQRAIEAGIESKKADAAAKTAAANELNAYTGHLKGVAEVAAGYEPDWSKILKSVLSGIGAIVPF